MINTLSLAFLILSGYIFAINSLTYSYKLKRAEGWGAYFFVAMCGGVFAALSWIVCSGLSYYGVMRSIYSWMVSHHYFSKELLAKLFPLASTSPSSVASAANPKPLSDLVDVKIAVWGMMSIVLALFASWVVLPFLGWIWWGENRKVMALDRAVGDDHHESMLIEASVRKYLILITLSSRKFYVGIVNCPRFENGKADYLAILPMISGYRDKNTLTTHITSNYKKIYVKSGLLNEDGTFIDYKNSKGSSSTEQASSQPKVKLEDFRTLIAYSEIQTISYFDTDTYNEFKADEEHNISNSNALSAQLMPKKNSEED